MRPQPVAALPSLTDAERASLREMWVNDALDIGAVVELAGRKLIVRGFDPMSAQGHRIYFDDAHTGIRFAVSTDVFR
jgi:hypothetical protein